MLKEAALRTIAMKRDEGEIVESDSDKEREKDKEKERRDGASSSSPSPPRPHLPKVKSSTSLAAIKEEEKDKEMKDKDARDMKDKEREVQDSDESPPAPHGSTAQEQEGFESPPSDEARANAVQRNLNGLKALFGAGGGSSRTLVADADKEEKIANEQEGASGNAKAAAHVYVLCSDVLHVYFSFIFVSLAVFYLFLDC